MNTVTLPSIEIDHSILLSLKESKEEFAKKMKLYSAILLYKKNRLSLGKAAMFVGMNKLDFIEALKAEGFYLFDYNDEQLQEIFDDAKSLNKALA